MGLTRAEAFAPATVANLGVGFDILGLALREPGDIVRAEPREEPGAVIAAIEGDGGKLSCDPEKNTAAVAANSLLRQLGATQGVVLTIYKHLPLASGLGSSAASAVAAAVAVNALLEAPLKHEELLSASLDGEAAVSGRHADNVAPCLFGGITLVIGISPADVHRLPTPSRLHLALITPDVAVPTAQARAVLPQSVPLRAMVEQTASVARLIDALYRDDIDSLARAMESDGIIEPARAHLMPHLAAVRAAAKSAGAHGVVISGAGPTLCGVCDSSEAAQHVSAAMKSVYDNAHIVSEARCSEVAEQGAHVLSTL
jgi:homoserine kinase